MGGKTRTKTIFLEHGLNSEMRPDSRLQHSVQLHNSHPIHIKTGMFFCVASSLRMKLGETGCIQRVSRMDRTGSCGSRHLLLQSDAEGPLGTLFSEAMLRGPGNPQHQSFLLKSTSLLGSWQPIFFPGCVHCCINLQRCSALKQQEVLCIQRAVG